MASVDILSGAFEIHALAKFFDKLWPVTFTEKLARLTEGQNRSLIARNAGLSATAITDYVQKRYIPRADNALALARALNVPLDWLVDDRRSEWPAPEATKVLPGAFSDQELMRELAVRSRHTLLDFISAAEEFDKFDWHRVAQEAEHTPPDQPLGGDVKRGISLLLSVNSKFVRWRNDFDLDEYCILHHESLPGAHLSLGEVDDIEAGFRFSRTEQNPDARKLMELVRDRPEYRDSGERQYVLAMEMMIGELYRRRRDAEGPLTKAIWDNAEREKGAMLKAKPKS